MKWLLAATLLVTLATLVTVMATTHDGSGALGATDGAYSCHDTTMVNAQGQIRGTLTICGYGLIRNCETLEGERC